jgi:hypothetical protein
MAHTCVLRVTSTLIDDQHACVVKLSPILYANIVRWHIEVGPTGRDQSFQCPVFVYTVDMISGHFMRCQHA